MTRRTFAALPLALAAPFTPQEIRLRRLYDPLQHLYDRMMAAHDAGDTEEAERRGDELMDFIFNSPVSALSASLR